jgi:hypothetical protein
MLPCRYLVLLGDFFPPVLVVAVVVVGARRFGLLLDGKRNFLNDIFV